ncbi:MAG: ERF family protein [Ktedonobacteraceae bacterium]
MSTEILDRQLKGSLLLEDQRIAAESAVAVPSGPITPMSLIQSAVLQGAGIDTIERLSKLQREMVEYDARVEFDKAMQRAQSKMKRIGTDAANPQTKSKYASYAKLDGALRPLYTEEGFALSFDTDDSPAADIVRVVCYTSHSSGHTRKYKLDMPADGKGAKGGDMMTKTHATGAAITYGSRYLLRMIFNVSVGDSDDDGNGASSRPMDMNEYDRYIGLIENAQTLEILKSTYMAACVDAKDMGDGGAMRSFVAAKDKRYRELAPPVKGGR